MPVSSHSLRQHGRRTISDHNALRAGSALTRIRRQTGRLIKYSSHEPQWSYSGVSRQRVLQRLRGLDRNEESVGIYVAQSETPCLPIHEVRASRTFGTSSPETRSHTHVQERRMVDAFARNVPHTLLGTACRRIAPTMPAVLQPTISLAADCIATGIRSPPHFWIPMIGRPIRRAKLSSKSIQSL